MVITQLVTSPSRQIKFLLNNVRVVDFQTEII